MTDQRVAIVAGATRFVGAGPGLGPLGPLALGLLERHEVDPAGISMTAFGVTVAGAAPLFGARPVARNRRKRHHATFAAKWCRVSNRAVSKTTAELALMRRNSREQSGPILRLCLRR
jgi:hypothetical protein